jgi:hypothetical protein
VTVDEPHHSWWNPDLSTDEFRELGYHVIDMIAEYYFSIGERPVFTARRSEQVAEVFAEQLPESGQEPHAILDEWMNKVLPHVTHVGSPRYFGFVMGSGTMMGTLAGARWLGACSTEVLFNKGHQISSKAVWLLRMWTMTNARIDNLPCAGDGSSDCILIDLRH